MHDLFHRFHLVILAALAVAVVWFIWSHLIRARTQESN